jgi:glutaredoxin
MRKLVLLVVIALALPWGSAAAQKMYKWIDAQGKISYHDRPPPEGSEITVEEKILGGRSSDGDENGDAARKFPVAIYTVSKCADCDLVRHYLKRRKVPFTEKSLDKDNKLRQELQEKSGGLSVPTIIVGTKVMTGYLESLLEGELKQAGYFAGEAPAPQAATSEPGADDATDEPPADGGLAPTE